MAFDLGDIAAIPGLIQSTRKDFGPIYGLINNAAIGTDGALAIMHNSQIEQLVRVNAVLRSSSPSMSCARCCRKATAGS